MEPSNKNIAARTPSLYLREGKFQRKVTLEATVLHCFPYKESSYIFIIL